MKYDFDTITDRRGTGSLKWDVGDNELPMWVADMDFKAAPEITEALSERISHGVFGYSIITKEWYDSYANWWNRRHGLSMDREGLIFCTGVVPAISSIVRKLTTPNENVVIQTPVYNIFFNSIINNGARVLESPLIYENGAYRTDLADLEKKLSDPQTSLMILCNPHNPVGKIWDGDTLAKIGRLCKKYRVTLISDEIHCDLTEPGKEYIPFASVSDDCREVSITCVAPTKAFNLAGMQSAAVYVPDPFLRHKVMRGLNTDEVAEPNSFAALAAITAFTKGEPWLDQAREYICKNRRTASDFIKSNIPQIGVVGQEATYLMWLDISALGTNSVTLAEFIRKETGLYLTAGTEYGKAGDSFLRMNIACPRALLLDGLERLNKGVKAFISL